MASYDHGGGCPCGLYRVCEPNCEYSEQTKREIEKNASLIPTDQTERFKFIDNMSLAKLKQASKWHQSNAKNSILYSRNDKRARTFEKTMMNDAMFHFLASVALELLAKAKENK